MPKVKIIDHPSIFSWKIKESVNDLIKLVNLDNYEVDLVDARNRPHRKKELLVSRILLQEQLPDCHIHYFEKRPILTSSKKEISITNSKELVFIMIQEEGKKTGIDVQYISKTVDRVKHKFLNVDEFSLPNIDNLTTLNILWSVKETLYKAYSEDKLEFKKQLIVKQVNNDSVVGQIIYPDKIIPFKTGLFMFNDFILTWFID